MGWGTHVHAASSLALPRIRHATLLPVLFHFHTYKIVHVHTGAIDDVWKMINKSVPTSLTTKDSTKSRLPQSEDLETCTSLAVALRKLNLPGFEPARDSYFREEQRVKKKVALAVVLTEFKGKMGAQKLKKTADAIR